MKYSTIWGRSIYIAWTNCHYMSLVIIKYNTYINFCFRFCRNDFITQWHTEKKNDYWKLRKQKIIKTLHSSTLFLHTVIIILGTIDAVQSKRWLYIQVLKMRAWNLTPKMFHKLFYFWFSLPFLTSLKVLMIYLHS